MAKQKGRSRVASAVIGGVLLAASLGLNLWQAFFAPPRVSSYVQTDEQVSIMEAGMHARFSEFAEGEEIALQYDFNHADYDALRREYHLAEIAGNGAELERAIRLMNAFSGRLSHRSNMDSDIAISALPLLRYSLDQKNNGVNCRCKAQILNEMCLSLGICARKVWLLPNSVYDDDCHVVNEIWDAGLSKWVMLDITNNEYWIDENGTPLSVMEIRRKGAERAFCTPIQPGESAAQPEALMEKHMGDYLYIMKNMVYMKYLTIYTAGETEPVMLLPSGFPKGGIRVISEASILRAPATGEEKD